MPTDWDGYQAGLCNCSRCKEKRVRETKENHDSKYGRLDMLRDQLGTERTVVETEIKRLSTNDVAIIPILHNMEYVELLFCGWAIRLNADGTWKHIQDTSGG